MGTTLFPLCNGGPEDDDGPLFPMVTIGGEMQTRLREAAKKKAPKIPSLGSSKPAKSFMKAAEGVKAPKHNKAKPKLGKKPKNLRAFGRRKKAGAFGESYKAVSAGKKGVRVAESEGES